MSMELIPDWVVKPIDFPKGEEYIHDIKSLRLVATGVLESVNPFHYIDEACQLLINSILLFQQGFFDCSFYSVRQSLELSLSGLYLYSNPEKIIAWRNLEDGFELRNIIKNLKKKNFEYQDVKVLFKDFFQEVAENKKMMNKYVHKQGAKSFYRYYNSIYSTGNSSREEALIREFQIVLRNSIKALTLYRLMIDPFPVMMLDNDVAFRMPDIVASPFATDFVEKYLSSEDIDMYKKSIIYQGYYTYFINLPLQNEAVYYLLHYQSFERGSYKKIIEQKKLLSIIDLEAVEIFMISPKIGSVVYEGWNLYSSETELNGRGMHLGESYYQEIFEGKADHNLPYKGDYISMFPLNGEKVYLIHNDILEAKEISVLHDFCSESTAFFQRLETGLTTIESFNK